jgi:hypothetical protein
MPKTLHAPPGFLKLSIPKQIDYLQDLWDAIAADAAGIPVPGWHKRILDERMARRTATGGRAKSWSETRRDVERTLRSRRTT